MNEYQRNENRNLSTQINRTYLQLSWTNSERKERNQQSVNSRTEKNPNCINGQIAAIKDGSMVMFRAVVQWFRCSFGL